MFRDGQQIGIYTLINRVGRGGFGEVWLAEKRSQFFTKKVAIKLPLDEQVNFEAIRQEAMLWEQASGHANVLPIIDADIYDGQVVIVSEYADGGSLADKLNSEGKLPSKQAVEMTIGILNGLEYLHNKRIIHRDIKPANILLQGDMPRLADFGISRAMQTAVISSKITGTDAYMSPESFRGLRTVETDIWSVGVVLYQLLNGRLPFPQENPSERMYAILQNELAPLSNDIPQDLRRIVEKALAKRPENRYRSAGKMRGELKDFLAILEARPQPVAKPISELSPKPSVNLVPEPNEETIVALPKTQLAKYQEQKTLPAIHLSSPAVSSESSEKPKKIWLVALSSVSAIILIVIVSLIYQDDNNISNTNNSNFVATPLLPLFTASPTPTPNYDIPDLRATVKELKLFESGSGTLPQDQRIYKTTFYKSSTRYVNYELKLEFPYPESTKYFTLEIIWYKGNNLLSSRKDSFAIEKTWTNTILTGGYGNVLYGSLGAGGYKVEIKYDGKVIASQKFDIQISLAGTWSGGSSWGDITMSGSGSSYTGSYTYPDGTFNLNKAPDGTYRGAWKNSTGVSRGAIEKAVVSADGDTLTVTWGYSYPESQKSSGRLSTWTRKKN
jgi:Serine/threonine protein kinase